MGLFTDINTNQSVNVDGQPVVIKVTKKGAIIVCPECKGKGQADLYDYGTLEKCNFCKGGGAIEVKVVKR